MPPDAPLRSLRIDPVPGGVHLHVKVVPNASRDQIVGPLGDALKIKVAPPPESGKANRAVCGLLARFLSLDESDVEVVAGHSNPRKRILIRGLDADSIRGILALDRP